MGKTQKPENRRGNFVRWTETKIRKGSFLISNSSEALFSALCMIQSKDQNDKGELQA